MALLCNVGGKEVVLKVSEETRWSNAVYKF